MYPVKLFATCLRCIMVHQYEIESTGEQLVLNRAETSGALWMAITHVVQRTIGMGN